MIKVFHPKLFQGHLNKRRYFEGWYFKHVSADNEHVFSVIPGVSLNSKEPHSFIQVIEGRTGFTKYVTYPLDSFKALKDDFQITIGNSVFSEEGIQLNIEEEGLSLSGELRFDQLKPYPSKFLAPGIMGWYTFVPFMECYHGVVSVNHRVNGILQWNKESITFQNGKGYIEKDWGKSFPESWIWLQCNSFSVNEASLMVSVAKIPWLGRSFIGFICFLYYEGRFYLFSTYNKSTLKTLTADEQTMAIVLQNKSYSLEVKAKSQKSGLLAAPSLGTMSRRIKESVDAEVHFQLKDSHGCILIEDAGQRAGLEIIESLLSLIDEIA